MLIDRSYFVGDINIPNTSNAAVGSLLDWFILKYETEFLDKVLGYELHKAFKTGLQEVSIPQKWIDLRDGVEYTNVQGKPRFWHGLLAAVSGDVSFDNSPIANYVYYWYMRNSHTQTSAMGEKKSKTENADNHSPANKMARAWNEMAECVRELVDYMNANKTDYPEWEEQDQWCMLRSFHPINEFSV